MRIQLLSLILLCISCVANAQGQGHKLSDVPPFQQGELLELKATVGFVKAAEATFGVSEVIYNINDRPTWKIDIHARTVGIFDFISSVRDNWGTYYDTVNYVPHQFYRYIKEGRFRKNEILYFDHEQDSVTVAKLHKESRKLEKTVMHAVPNNVQDMVSGYYYLRSIDFSQVQIGDIITIDTFFDDKLEPFRVKLVKREVLDTDLGDINTLVLVPIIKKDSLFEEDNTITVWLSDDLNKIPLKLQAKIYVGYLKVQLTDAKNLRHPLARVD
tara:strand:- start:135 stop:947 length:813 start_codon:yes stop_codon:yes gene_type:complete